MQKTHCVEPGESLGQIAREHDFARWDPIFSHPDNVKLRQARNEPKLIFPKDNLTIPKSVPGSAGAATGKRTRFQVRFPRTEQLIKNINVLVHGVNTDAAWFRDVDAAMKALRIIEVESSDAEHIHHYVVVPFSWGDYETGKQGGLPHYAVDELQQMFENPRIGYDRIYQGHSVVRLKELLDECKKLGTQVNVIAHSNGTLITAAALILGASIDNFIIMGSPLDCDNERSQNQLAKALTKVSGETFNFWSPDDEWAHIKGGIGAFGDNKVFRSKNPGIKGFKFIHECEVRGVKVIASGDSGAGWNFGHSDYQRVEHMPIFSGCIREFSKSSSARVQYDETRIKKLELLGDWTSVSYYIAQQNVTRDGDPLLRKYRSQIDQLIASK